MPTSPLETALTSINQSLTTIAVLQAVIAVLLLAILLTVAWRKP